MGRIPVLGAVPRSAQRTFNSFLGAGRIMMFDGFADAAKKEGGEAELFRLARMVDTMMGGPSSKGLGVGGTQRQIESGFVAFSARYTRSVFGAIAYMFGKGYTPSQTRKILGKMLFGGIMTYGTLVEGIGVAQGKTQEEIRKELAIGLDPRSGSRYMSIRMGESWYGLGGAYRSLLGFMGNMSPWQKDDKDNWDFDSWGDAAANNPITRYLRGRTSPLSGGLFDFIQGEDFLGRTVTLSDFGEDPERILEYIFQKLGPFPLQAFVETGGTTGMKVSSAGVEAIGFRSTPINFTDAANDITKDIFPSFTYKEIESHEQREVRAHDRVKEVAGRRESTGYFKRRDEIDEEHEKSLLALAKLSTSEIPAEKLDRNQVTNAFFSLRTERRLTLDEAANNFNIKFDNELEADATSDDRALAAYHQAREDASETGIYLSERFDEKYQILWSGWTKENRGYVLRNTNYGLIPEEIMNILRRTAKGWVARREASIDQRRRHKAKQIASGKRIPDHSIIQ